MASKNIFKKAEEALEFWMNNFNPDGKFAPHWVKEALSKSRDAIASLHANAPRYWPKEEFDKMPDCGGARVYREKWNNQWADNLVSKSQLQGIPRIAQGAFGPYLDPRSTEAE